MTPMSPTGLNKTRYTQQAGFTLVEVLAVLLIFGLMAAAVVFTLPAKPIAMHEEGRQMASRIRLAQQSAMVEQKVLGVTLREQGYDVVRYSGDLWLPMEQYDYGLETAPRLTLIQNGARIDLEQAAKLAVPMIRFDTTGLGTPFDLRIEGGGETFIIRGDVSGQISTGVLQ